jgi:hypothetical protein
MTDAEKYFLAGQRDVANKMPATSPPGSYGAWAIKFLSTTRAV